jgi:hypothetical protein
MLDCSKVPVLKRRVTLGLLIFIFTPLLVAIIGSLLGELGVIGSEAMNALEFAALAFESTLLLGGVAFIVASIYFSIAEHRCGIQHKASFLNIVAGVIVGVVCLIVLSIILFT